MPKVLLEASACEKVVVSTKVPGCKDVVIDKRTGLLAEPRNIIDLSEKIEFLIKNKDHRRKMGANGRKHIESYFSLEYVIKEHLKKYKELLG